MQLVEQLQVKRTEANTRLLSRKRKLSELFSATVCTGDISNTVVNQEYIQQLQAFYDANDLQKGRTFNDSTLPPRPRITRLSQQKPFKPTNNNVLKQAKDARRSRSPLKSDPTVSVTAHNVDASKSDQPVSTEIRQDEVQTRPHAPTQGDHRSRTPNGDVVLSGRDGILEKPGGQGKPDGVNGVAQDSKVNKGHEGRGIAATTNRVTDNHVSMDNVAEDRHSSPASSNQPGSDTPGPIAGSPNTSPGGEDAPLEVLSQSTDKKLVPSSSHVQPETPDTESVRPLHKMSVSSLDVDMTDVDPITGFDSPVKSTPSVEQSISDHTSRKPPIRINTDTRPAKLLSSAENSAIVETPAPITGSETPRQRLSSTPISAVDTTKRATRISSGALQKKSVSEILGETPKILSPHSESPLPTISRDAFAMATIQGRQIDRERKEKERTKLSTVVFAKPQKPSDNDTIEVVSNTDLEKATSGDRDYLYTLFESKAYSSKSGNLSHLIQHSHKAITTVDHLIDYEYQAQCRVLKRLYQLQSADRWALRQRKRVDEPPRRTAHWDFLLDHAKWMRTDFREERKWKYAAARALAEFCAEWVLSTPEERKLLQVQVRAPRSQMRVAFDDMVVGDDDDVSVSAHPTPELLASGEDESVSDDIADPRDISLSNAPAAIFSLGAGEFNFVYDRTPAFDKLINELPLYEPAKIVPDLANSNIAQRLDARWKTDIVPVSRFATEKLVVKDQKAPIKRSRYEYELESSPQQKTKPLPPRDENVGLFMSENKHIRDRIHPGHSFRPPSEHPMPTQSFFETRSSSQWTAIEDDELRKLVKDYSYNWSLISSCLTSRSLYSSSPDRRTPWECFERWIGLEGMPADMAKTPYFRTYSGRIEAAGRHVQAQLEEAQRRAGPTVPITVRKRTTQPVRVERKRASRHLAMLDAMRKLAKKREVHRQKQAHSADMAAQRKSNEVNQPRLGAKTPAEWSQLKYEREQKLAKQQELYRQQLIAHQRAATAQQQRSTGGPVNGVPNGMPQGPSNVRAAPNGTPVTGMPNGQMPVPNGVPRPHPGMMNVPNGMPMPNGMNIPKGLPAQMQANMRNGMTGSPQHVRMLNEAQKMHQEQLIRQAQQNGNHSSPNIANASMANGHGMNNPAFMAAMSGANGVPSPNGMSGNSSSPRGVSMGQALSSGHVPVLAQIAANIKERHPTMTDEEVQRHASQQLTTWQQQATAAAAGQPQRARVNQAALNAAMGAANAAANAGMAAAAAANGGYPQNMTQEQLQQYNQRMRMQHAQHAARGMQGQLQPNMMAQMNSPVMNMSRPVSQHNNQGMSRSATPRDQANGSVSTPQGSVTITQGSGTINGGNTPMNGVQGQQGQLQQGQQGSPRANQPQPMQT